MSVTVDEHALAACGAVLAGVADSRGGIVFQHASIERRVRRFVLALPDPANGPELIVVDAVPEAGGALSRLASRAGFHVAVLGPDGVGKSTIVANLASRLRRGFSGTESTYMRPGLLPGRTAPGGPGGNTGPHDVPPYGPLGSVLKLGFLLADYVFGYWLLVGPKLRAGRLVVHDRYYLDIAADPLRYRYGGPGRLVRGGARLVPGPDLYVVLQAPTDTIQSRRDEMTPGATAAQAAGYAAVAREYPRVITVNANQAPEAVLADVAWAVARAMSQRLESA